MLMKALIGLLTLTAFANALKCQTDIENGGYRTRLSSKPNAMCLYRAYPCDFDKPNEYGLRENVDPKYNGRCTTRIPVECYCGFDNCNVDYNFLTEIWLKSEATDKTMLQCMTDHLHDLKRFLRRRRAQDYEDASTSSIDEEAKKQDKLAQVEEEVTESDKGTTVVGLVHDPPESTDNGEEEFMTDETNGNADVEGAPSESKQESDTDESNVDADEESAPSEDYTGSTLIKEEMTVPDDSESTLHQGIGNADAKKKLKQYSSAQAAENTGSTALTYSLPLIIILLTKHLLGSLFVEEVIMM